MQNLLLWSVDGTCQSLSSSGRVRADQSSRPAPLLRHFDRVNIIKHVKVDGQWRYAAVVEDAAKIVPNLVWVRGAVESHPEGSYTLDWYEDGHRRHQSIGTLDDACKAARLKRRMASASPGQFARLQISAAIKRYLEQIEVCRSRSTFLSYRSILRSFERFYYRTYLDQVQRRDVLDFVIHLYRQGLCAVTVQSKLIVVLQWLKFFDRPKLLLSNDWPICVEALRPTYEERELEAMFRNTSGRERLLLQFLLASGLRDREVQHLVWRDFDWRDSLVRVTAKPHWHFSPKNAEERVVPLPRILMEQLQEVRKRCSACSSNLVFPSSRGDRNRDVLKIIKRAAYQAGLNCGECLTRYGHRCDKGPYCKNFSIQKFRHTFATEHLRHGIDVRTLQRWLGHRNIQSTMIYLRGLEPNVAVA
jgi:integrase/recombinase XerD